MKSVCCPWRWLCSLVKIRNYTEKHIFFLPWTRCFLDKKKEFTLYFWRKSLSNTSVRVKCVPNSMSAKGPPCLEFLYFKPLTTKILYRIVLLLVKLFPFPIFLNKVGWTFSNWTDWFKVYIVYYFLCRCFLFQRSRRTWESGVCCVKLFCIEVLILLSISKVSSTFSVLNVLPLIICKTSPNKVFCCGLLPSYHLLPQLLWWHNPFLPLKLID